MQEVSVYVFHREQKIKLSNKHNIFKDYKFKISTKCELTRKNLMSCSMSTPQCEILLLRAIFKLPFIYPKCKNENLSTYKAPVQHV